MGSRNRRLAIASLALVLATPLGLMAQTDDGQPVGTNPQVAQPSNGGVNWKGAGLGAAALVANVGYIPAKMAYAIVGGITGGFGYALTGGNEKAANTIWRSSLGGDYVVTPDMLSGQAPLHFSGPAGPDADQTQFAPAPSPPVSSNPPPATVASSTPVYPNPPAPATSTTTTTTSVGAPPYGSASSGSTTHFTTSITGPADSGAGPVREHDIE
jgi:hypothetical protein